MNPLKSRLYVHRNKLVIGVITLVIGIFYFAGPIPQITHYHQFANQSSWLRIVNAENVLTNMPFLIVGFWGLFRFKHFVIESDIERISWYGFFIFIALTALGSAYYHLEPNHFRLIFDRIPIALSFIFLFNALIAERVSTKIARNLLAPMFIYSIASILYWYYTETIGVGDLRPYILVQLLPILLMPILLELYSPKYSKGWMFYLVGIWYFIAKLLEVYDHTIFDYLGFMSGHGMKHLFSALSCAQVAWMLEKRRSLGV